MNILGNSIKELRKTKKLTQKNLAELTGFKQNTISNHENGNRQLDETDIRVYAEALGVSPQYLFDRAKPSSIETIPQPATSPIQTIYDQLEPPGQRKVITYAEKLRDEQEKRRKAKKNEVSEKVIDLYQVEVVSETAAASGFNYGFGYDDTDRETIEVDEQPPRHDIATKVSGDSMQPDYQDGDILYLVDKGLTTYNGDLAVIAYGDRSYFKKIYTENGRLRLVSLNDKYEDIILDFPPAEDTHIKIYAVVGVYRG